MNFQDENVSQVWDQVASAYKEIDVRSVDYQASVNVLLEYCGNPSGKSFCEVGCGSGVVSALLARLGGEITLVDIAPEALSFAGEYFARQELTARLCQNNALEMDFPDSTFDVVWNFGVVEHFYDSGKIKLLAEMWRVVKPGGLLFVTAPNRWDIPFMIYKRFALWRNIWPYGYEDDLTRSRVVQLAEKAGLADPEVFAFNPVVGWWFIKGGINAAQQFGFNTVARHMRRSMFGHVICLAVRKPLSEHTSQPSVGVIHES